MPTPPVASVLAGAAAVLAFVAAVSAVPVALVAPPEQVVAEAWRCVGLATFAGLFAVLAARPARSLTLWFLAVASKGALVLVGIALGPQVPGASDLVVWDGVLCGALALGTGSVWRARSRQTPDRRQAHPADA